MSVDVVMCFGSQARPYRAAVARAVHAVSGVAGELLEGCDVGVRTPVRALILRVRLCDGPATAEVVDRLAYWSARAHGFAVALRGELERASCAVADALQASDRLEVAVPAADLPDALDRALDSLWPYGGLCAASGRRLHDRGACAPRLAARHASRRPRRHSPVGRSLSRSPNVTS